MRSGRRSNEPRLSGPEATQPKAEIQAAYAIAQHYPRNAHP